MIGDYRIIAEVNREEKKIIIIHIGHGLVENVANFRQWGLLY